jgi:hypothetical protein
MYPMAAGTVLKVKGAVGLMPVPSGLIGVGAAGGDPTAKFSAALQGPDPEAFCAMTCQP